MQLVTFNDEAGARLGVLRGETVLDVARAAVFAGEEPPPELRDMLVLINGGVQALERVRALSVAPPPDALLNLSAAELLAPIPRPRKNIFCLGRNYAEHAAESLRAIGQEVKLPPYPNIFTKAPTAITGPHADVPYDASLTEELDWEVELAAVIGTAGRHIRKEDALRHVWGYTVLNDVTARDIQNKSGVQWFQGKSVDASSPMGPCIVTADEIPDPQQLRLRLWINSQLKQDDTTGHMLFDVATIIETLSRVLTLEPGDIIATGTPSGVGFARTPPEYLHPGDLMQSEVEGIGTLMNRVVEVK
jgi:2-keto-4-pentenoate hydratase/2-oxohepta-3-ene-1,7-dioic acid hydratase in catechol pathway